MKKIGNVSVGSCQAEGKTKKLFPALEHPGKIVVLSKNDITAGDGKKHDIIIGKGAWSTRTTCNVFRLLSQCGIDLAFTEQLGPTEFLAWDCDMLPLEVVLRRKAMGSFLQRNPHIPKGWIFPQLVFELFLKTNGRRWKNHRLPCDDPLMVVRQDSDTVELYNPHKLSGGQKPFLTLPFSEVFKFKNVRAVLERIEYLARRQFLILEKAWALLGRDFIDMKVEFGVTKYAWTAPDMIDPMKILLADVIDADSWRTLFNGLHEDKQFYREDGALDKMAEKYALTSALTDRFMIPRQQVIVWTGSKDDDVSAFRQAFEEFVKSGPPLMVQYVVSSMHKSPVDSILTLNRLLGEVPDAVVIDYVGMSNGAGPTLSANCSVPVINVPAKITDSPITFAHDVWSSLRLPSNVPAITTLAPKNAVLAALQILAINNPSLYACLRYDQEKRFTNVVTI